MKRSSIVAMVCLGMLMGQQLIAQQNKWYINQFAIDFSNGTAQVNNLPLTYSIAPGNYPGNLVFAENSQGFYDNNGNIIFYTAVREVNGSALYDIVNAAGNVIGTLTKSPQQSAEMSVVPFGCANPNSYLLVYASCSSSNFRVEECQPQLTYAVVNTERGNVGASQVVSNVSTINKVKAHAVGKRMSDGRRWLYVNDSKFIAKCVIDFTQTPIIKKLHNIASSANQIELGEMELAANQRFLAWTDHNSSNSGHFSLINLNTNGDHGGYRKNVTIPSSNINSAQGTGIEFDLNSLYLYVGYNTLGGDPTKDGIYRYDRISGGLGLLPNTNGLQKSHIEKAGNGRFYAARYNQTANVSQLVDIFSQAAVSIPNNTYFTYKINTSLANYQSTNSSALYSLPDQIDGEVIDTDYNLPDLSHLNGAVCKDQAILHIPSSFTNYTVTVEKAFQQACVYEGSSTTLNLANICDIRCGDACNNSIRVTITASCDGENQSSVTSGVFHILCGPIAPKIKLAKTTLCPGETTSGEVITNYPAGTTIEWIQNGNVIQTGPSASGLSGGFTVRVTDANGCTNESDFSLAISNCNFFPFEKGASENNVLKLYPNPASESVEVQLTNQELIQQVVIKDKLGEPIKNLSFKTATHQQKLDIKGLNEGIYVLELVTKQGKRYTQKLLVK